MLTDECKIPVEKLAWKCDPEIFEFETTDDVTVQDDTIGQERAIRSINFGLGMVENGFNLYLAGETGTGRTTSIMSILKKRARDEPPPQDWCYVYNFKSPDNPLFLALPVGMGKVLEQDIKELLQGIKNDIPKSLQSKEYELDKNKIIQENQEKNNELFSWMEKECEAKGYALQRTVSGLVVVPQKEGRNMTQEEYEQLPDDEKQKIDETGNELKGKLADVLSSVRENEKEVREALARLDRDLGLSALGHRIEPLNEKYKSHCKVIAYLESVQEDILLNLDDFKGGEQQQQIIPGLRLPATQTPSFERYTVNVFVDNSNIVGAPVVYEANPTYNNLFGRIDHVVQMGGVTTTNFTLIKPGALHRANGGYLVLDARQVLINPFAWDALKRCISNSEIKIEDVLEQYRFITIVSLKPEPVPLKAKIIMIGSSWIYYLLYYMEPEYRKLFKVKADFETRVKKNADILKGYAQFVTSHCKKENLLPFHKNALSALMEYAARRVEDQNKLSSQFMEITDLIREGDYWARQEGKKVVDAEALKRAIEEKVYRSNLFEERIQELIAEGTLFVDTEGAEVGQVNGLSVIQLADYMFGRPSRVTARIFMGRAGMVNIEREVKLSGPIHDKGVMILTGYLGGKYAHDKPLAFSASICFEQSYEGVEGDSASSTELYALLSALSGVPLKQGIAVTGSVNQLGRIQPIGGVNHKIEGFYAVCKEMGLTGDQGVMIPKSNERNLMLKDEVIDAVKTGKFNVWSVETIDQGIELLTGVPAGEMQPDGSYPEGTINFLVDKRLKDMVERMKKFSAAEKEEKKQEERNS